MRRSRWRRRRRRRRRSLFRIIHARIPNEMGSTQCRAMPALTNQPTRSAPGLPVPAVNSSLPFAPSWTWCLDGQTGHTRRECQLPPLRRRRMKRRVILSFQEERNLFRILHARGAVPNEMGPTSCRARGRGRRRVI